MIETIDIQWKKKYETGIEDIDTQHKTLVNTIYKANELLNQDYSLDNLQNITKELLNYTLYHFETEEEMMLEYNYDDYHPKEYEQHIKQHREFSSKVTALRTSLETGQLIEQEKMIGFLINWLINHINRTDKKLGSFLHDKM